MTAPNPERRSERARTAILGASIELCRELGYAKVTMEGMAKRAGVGKQTIYRWWPSKAAVVLEALSTQAATSAAFPDTGDIVTDLRTQMKAVAALLASPEFAPFGTGLIAAAQTDAEVSRSLLSNLIEPRAAACRARLEKAKQDGQLRADVDVADVVEVLYGPLYYRLLLHTRPVEPAQIDAVLDLTFGGLRPADR